MHAGAEIMPTYAAGDYVKAEFRDERSGEAEWMWIRVEFADDSQRIVFGWLDNEPLAISDELRVGQRMAISYDNVREHAKSAEFPPR